MDNRELTCIGCPLGCQIKVAMECGEIIKIEGNTCKKGEIYARKEVTAPTRIVTSSLPVRGGDETMVSVKTREDIPKGKIWECLSCMEGLVLEAPVGIGDIIVEDIAGTGVPLVATREICKIGS